MVNSPKVGEKAPDFSGVTAYHASEFIKVSSSTYLGRWLVLFFYPRDFTFVCPTEIEGFADLEEEFEKAGAAIIAVSTDSEWSHKNWYETDERLKKVKYPVIADTTHEVSNAYNILALDGAAQRGTFIIDPDGVLRWMTVSDNSIGRSVKETLRVLKAFQTGELCPVEWEPGEETLKGK